MPWEYITDSVYGNWPEDSSWMECQAKIVAEYLKLVCGDPPIGCHIGLTTKEHDLGDYPIIGLYWGELGEYHPPMDYVVRCQNVCGVFLSSIDWDAIDPIKIREKYCPKEKIDEDSED